MTTSTAAIPPEGAVIHAVPVKRSLLEKFGQRYELDAGKVMNVIAQTAFRQGKEELPLSAEEMAAALIVANQYELNPLTKEIYAFRSKGRLLIVVSVDGWAAIVNRQEKLDGIEFDEHFDKDGKINAVTCRMYRKDRRLPVAVTEYTAECKRNTEPWNNMPIRMTRNRAFVQCARIAFSISGILDEDDTSPMLDAALMPPSTPLLTMETEIKELPQLKDLATQIGWNDADLWNEIGRNKNDIPKLIRTMEDLIGKIAAKSTSAPTPTAASEAAVQPAPATATESSPVTTQTAKPTAETAATKPATKPVTQRKLSDKDF